ncbi:MAG: hypothetical protein ABIH55_00635 [Nanoarchaeota archaeon]
MKFHFDFTSNVLKSGIKNREEVKNQIKNRFLKNLDDIVDRLMKIKPFLTHKGGLYLDLHQQAISAYSYNMCYAAIALEGIAAERFISDIFNNIKIKINDKKIRKPFIFEKEIDQKKKLKILLKSEILDSYIYGKLEAMRKKRNEYIHPKLRQYENAVEDAHLMINLFNDVLNLVFSKKFYIKNGNIVKRLPSSKPASSSQQKTAHKQKLLNYYSNFLT